LYQGTSIYYHADDVETAKQTNKYDTVI